MSTRVKICGITRVEDALHAAAAGASYLGYIFYAPSKRFIAPRSAKEIVQQVRSEFPDVQHVGVFVDETAENIAWIRNLAGLDLVQLHGNESPELCRELSAVGIDVIKVLPMAIDADAPDFRQFDVRYYLCDTHDAKLKGGTGRTFDISRIPADLPREMTFLAGGLTPENVDEMISAASPYCVDVSTGVEEKPGIKSRKRVTKFIENANRASAGVTQKGQ